MNLVNLVGGTVSANSGDRYLVGKNPTGPNWSKYGNTMPIVEWNSFGQFWSETFLEDGITVYVDLEEVQYKYSSGSPVIVTGGTEWSDKKGNERDITSSDYLIELKGGTPSNPKSQIIKKVETINQKSGEMLMLSIDNTIVKYGGSASREVPSGIPDIDIVNRFIDDWKRIVPNYDLKLCNPSNQKCELIEYISPIQPLPGPSVEPTGGSPSGASPSGLTVSKQKLTIVFPEDFKVMAREDVPKFSIWIGEPQSEESVDGFDFGPDSPFVIDEEYVEEPFVGSEEDFQVSECQFYESESDQKQTEEQAAKFNDASSNSVGANGQLNDEKMKESYTNYVPGKHKLDLIPGELVANGKSKIKCCAVPLEWYSGKSNVKPINVVIAPALIDMLTAAKEAGHSIVISSGFRPAFGPNLSAKTESGLSVSAESQEVLYAKNCPGGVCGKTETAKPGSSRHGNGIAVDLNTGTRDPNNVVQFGKLRNDVYKWLVKNSWKFGFVRAVKSEEWHWEYYGEAAIKGGPYYKIGKGGGSAFKKGESNFYSDLGVNNLQSPNYT
jgi:LAS superfamily LD-carboxypeptidase LdcB